MKVYVLICEDYHMDAKDVFVHSIHRKEPDLPKSTYESCGCCYRNYIIQEMEVKK